MTLSASRSRRAVCRRCLLREVRGQGMTSRLVEEGRFLRGRFQKLLVLVVDVVAELYGLVLGHPGGEIDPGHREFLRQVNIVTLAGRNRGVDGGSIPLRHGLQKPRRKVAHIVDARTTV